MHRFYCPGWNPRKTISRISDPKEIHHIKNVLRYKRGDRLLIFDGKGTQGEGSIKTISKDLIEIDILSFKSPEKKKYAILLACALPKRSKFETIVEKATELGVDEIIPLITSRTEVILNEEKSTLKNSRFQTIAINASEQAQRNVIPHVHPVMKFSNALDLIDKETSVFIACLNAKRKPLVDYLKNLKKLSRKVIFFIGPEGDFTKQEVLRVTEKGGFSVSLGPNVLKVETAAITVMALANCLLSS